MSKVLLGLAPEGVFRFGGALDVRDGLCRAGDPAKGRNAFFVPEAFRREARLFLRAPEGSGLLLRVLREGRLPVGICPFPGRLGRVRPVAC